MHWSQKMVLNAIDKSGPTTASCSFPHFLPPSPRKKVSQLEFVRTIVHQYVRFDRKNWKIECQYSEFAVQEY